MDAHIFLVEYTQAQHLEPRMQRIENDVQEQAQILPTSHELLSHDHSSSEKDNEWVAYLKILKEMDEESGKGYIVEEGHVETISLHIENKYIIE